MCQMASEALLAGRSSLASCPGMAHDRLKRSRYSILPLTSVKGLCRQQRLVSCLASPQNSLCCQPTTLLQLPEKCADSHSSNSDRLVSSPDRWMEGCVRDIVRNIKDAPFLHMLYDSDNATSGVKSQRQKVIESENSNIEDKWEEMKDLVRDASPDGVILVHRLSTSSVEGCCMRDGLPFGCPKAQAVENKRILNCCDSTKLWGVLVLGKTIAKSACYILQTTSVTSPSGTCTQFCLTKAKCFGPSWNDQMQNCWLNSEFGGQVPRSSI